MKRGLLSLLFISILTLNASTLQAQTLPPDKKNSSKVKAQYAKDRFIVKFKSEGPNALNDDAEYLLENNQKFQQAVSDRSDSLDKRNKKYNVKRAKSLFIERHGRTTVEAKENQVKSEKFSKAMHQNKQQRAARDAVSPDLSNVYVLEVPPAENIDEIVADYRSDPHVEYAQPDYLIEAYMVPNDTYYSSLWGLGNIKNPQAWDITQGEGVVVAVVDTGLDYNHPDIAANVWTNLGEIPNNGLDDDSNGFVDDVRGWDFTLCQTRDASGNCTVPKLADNDPMDGHGHGTHVAGTIAAVGNNGIGIIGVAPQAKIMPLKGLEDSGIGTTSLLANAIVYAARNGADVINNSWGCSACPSNPIAEDAVRTAYSLGAVVVFAAGNSATEVMSISPQNMTSPKPIVVAAATSTDTTASFSNFGALIDVAAPGSSILSLRANNTGSTGIVGTDYITMSGTSMAAPHASGVAALLLAHRPTLTNEEVRQMLRASADDILSPGFDMKSGSGRLNAARALTIIPPKLSAQITSPVNGARYSFQQNITIAGTASGTDFKSYELFYGVGVNPSSWISTGPIPTSIQNAPLGSFEDVNASGQTDPVWLVRLVVTAVNGVQFDDVKAINISNLKPITTNSASQTYPAISGSRIVWHDNRNDFGDIYMYDLSANTERRITTNSSQQLYPDISGNWIVWVDNRNSRWDIYAYDLSSNVERRITTNAALIVIDNNELAISGNFIVWEDSRNGNSDIYLYDLGTNTERQITTNLSNQRTPSVSGNRIVWTDFRNGNSDIYLYDLSTNTERQITTNSDIQSNPAISGDRIVWQDRRSIYHYDIYLYDLSTNTERGLITNSSSQYYPAISGNQVVWIDDRNGSGSGFFSLLNMDIYLYDLNTNIEKQITGNTASQLYPAISGNQVVWADLRNGNYDIYATVPKTPVVAGRGVNSSTTTTLSADWTSSDALSGASESQYAIGTSRGATDIVNWSSVGSSTTVMINTNLVSGRTYYFSVKTKNTAGVWSAVGYSSAIVPVNAANITSPSPGSTLTSSTVTFQWSAVSGAQEYYLAIGDCFQNLNFCGTMYYEKSQGLATSVTVSGLPLKGQPVYVTLFTKINNYWYRYLDVYTYQTVITTEPSKMISPVPGTTLSSSPVTFQWDQGLGVTSNWIYISSVQPDPNSGPLGDIYQGTPAVKSSEVITVPMNGKPIYVRLYSNLYDGVKWFSGWNDYVYWAGPIGDLVVSALSMTTGPVTPGVTFSVSNTVANQGSASAGASVVGFVLSSDAVYGGTNDIALTATRSVASLAAGASSAGSTTLTVPAATPYGNYYVCAGADKNAAVIESNETNNSRCTTVTIQVGPADLIMTAVSGPASGVTGTSVAIANTVKNQGVAKTGSFTVGLYLSIDAAITTADARVGTRSVSSLLPGASSSASTAVTLPSSLAAGVYYVGAIADYTNTVTAESNESNNALAGATMTISSGPDLVMTVVSGPASAPRGTSITVSNSILNQGTGTATNSSTVGIYLSTDAVITTADRRIGTRSIPALSVGVTSTAGSMVTIPGTLAVGTYYIGAIVDYSNTVKESNEGNNALAGNAVVVQ